MPTKKDVAFSALGLARTMHDERGGEEDVEGWIMRLLWIADDLYPPIRNHPWYGKLMVSGETRMGKLCRLIEHPSTPPAEREAAVQALDRLRRAKART